MKKAIYKLLIYDSNYITSLKWQHFKNGEQINGWQNRTVGVEEVGLAGRKDWYDSKMAAQEILVVMSYGKGYMNPHIL